MEVAVFDNLAFSLLRRRVWHQKLAAKRIHLLSETGHLPVTYRITSKDHPEQPEIRFYYMYFLNVEVW